MKKWYNVPGTFEVDLLCSEVPEVLEVFEPLGYSLIIDFKSTGYDDPGSRSGPSETWIEDDYEDVREPVSITLVSPDGHKTPAPEEWWEEIMGYYEHDIAEVEIEK